MIATPRGIKIPLPLHYCFALMARLYPKVKPFEILQTAQALYKMHGAFSAMVAVICFALQASTHFLSLATIVSVIAGHLMASYARFPPGLLAFSTAYSQITGFGIVILLMSLIGLMTVGIEGALAFWGSRLVGELATIAMDRSLGVKKFLTLFGDAKEIPQMASLEKSMTMDGFAVRCFGNSYAIHAVRLGLFLKADVSDVEMNIDSWHHIVTEFVSEWPQVARRFQVTEQEWEEILNRPTAFHN